MMAKYRSLNEFELNIVKLARKGFANKAQDSKRSKVSRTKNRKYLNAINWYISFMGDKAKPGPITKPPVGLEFEMAMIDKFIWGCGEIGSTRET